MLIRIRPLNPLTIPTVQRYKRHRYMQVLLSVVSIASGARLIYIINWEGWHTVLDQVCFLSSLCRVLEIDESQCAPLGTLWVLTIALMDLTPAVLALIAVAAFVKWKKLKIVFDP